MRSQQLGNQALEMITSFDMLVGLSAAELGTFASVMTKVNIPKDTVFIHENSEDDAIYLITRGQAEVLVPGVEDKERAVLAAVGPGEPIGEFALARTGQRSASARAVTHVQALRTTALELRTIFDQNPNIGYHVYRNLLRITVERLEETNLLARQAA
jgi:CRP-like cAMP-binding protein